MKRVMFISLLSLAAAAFPQSITLVSPNGGETLTSSQPAMVRWKSEKPGVYVWLEHSVDNGKRWRTISTSVWATADSCTWTPMVKNRVDKIILRITADTNVYALSLRDTSDSCFVILPSPGDDYEPNDDFASACPISLGDSVIKNAFVFGVDSLEPDSAFFDVDYYKISLEAGKLLTVCMIPWGTDRFGSDQRFEFVLFDSLKSLLYSDAYFQNRRPCCITPYNVIIPGTYYIKIRSIYNVGYGTPYHYGLSVLQRDYNGLITVVFPKGGEIFNPEDTVEVQYLEDSVSLDRAGVEYSIDSGKSWRDASGYSTTSTSRLWKVPHLKHGTDRALIRVFPMYMTNPPYGISNGTFTICASPNDAYEPNDDFSSAAAVGFGDTVVKNAIVMKSFVGSYSGAVDTSLTDNDFFKLNLTAGNVVTISNLCDHGWDDPEVLIRLYDASKNEIEVGYTSLSCYITQTGVYYCEISSSFEYDCWNKYCLSIRQAGGSITLISPNGGENLNVGQLETIEWTADSSVGSIAVFYSRDNGIIWENVGYFSSDGNRSLSWDVPALSMRTDQALVKVARIGVTNPPFDVSDRSFTIQAAPMDDPYEPNNDAPTAYPIAMGDSVVKNVPTCWYADVPGMIDYDFFKVNLTAGSLVGLRFWSSEGNEVQCYLLDSSQIKFHEILGSRYYHIYTQSGVYYIRICPFSVGRWAKYGFSINAIKILMTQISIMDSATMQFDSSTGVFRGQLNADSAKLTVDFSLDSKFPVWNTAMTLAPRDCAPLPNEKAKVRAFALMPRLDTRRIRAVDIVIPYSISDLNGNPEKSLAVASEDPSSGQWVSIPGLIDTVKHQIVAHLTCLYNVNIFQVYIKLDAGIGPIISNPRQRFGIQANALSEKRSIAVHFALPKAANAELRLYNVQGKCVRRGIFPVRPACSTLQWNLGALSNGKYILTVKAGSYRAQETLLIVE